MQKEELIYQEDLHEDYGEFMVRIDDAITNDYQAAKKYCSDYLQKSNFLTYFDFLKDIKQQTYTEFLDVYMSKEEFLLLQKNQTSSPFALLTYVLCQTGYTDKRKLTNTYTLSLYKDIMYFQTKNGLLRDGKVGPETLAILIKKAKKIKTDYTTLQRHKNDIKKIKQIKSMCVKEIPVFSPTEKEKFMGKINDLIVGGSIHDKITTIKTLIKISPYLKNAIISIKKYFHYNFSEKSKNIIDKRQKDNYASDKILSSKKNEVFGPNNLINNKQVALFIRGL